MIPDRFMTASWRDLYPFDVSRAIEIRGWQMHYLDAGPRSTREAEADNIGTILCVHGNPTWSFYYRRVVEQFASDHRVVAVDHLGCGLSDKPSASEYPYSLAARRDDLVELIERLDLQRITLLAHDWGGAIGLAAAAKVIKRMRGIVLLNTAAFPPPYVPWRIGILRTPLLGSLAIRSLNAFAGPAVTMAMSRQKLSPEAAAGLLAPYSTYANRVAVDGFARDIPLSKQHPTYRELEALEQSLDQFRDLPIQLIWGMQDWCFRPECLERFLKHWPQAQAVRLSDTGHYVMEDNPEAMLSAMQSFLGEHGL